MAMFVDIASEEEVGSELISFFHKLKVSQDGGENESNLNAFNELKTLVQNNKTKEVLSSLVEKQALVFSQANEKDIEGFFNCVFSLLRKLDASSTDELEKRIIANLISEKTDRPLLRLKILNNLYNIFDSDSLSRYGVFIVILQFALESKTTEVVVPHFKRIEDWLKTWGASLDQTRVLYKLAHKILEETNRNLQAYSFLLKYLHTFDNKTDPETLASAKPEARKAAVQAIKTPEIHQMDDLLEMPAIRQLENDPTDSQIYELLKLFTMDKLDSFQSFHQKYPDYLKNSGLSHEDCVKKIRLLSLASLATEHQEIPYSLIASTLGVDKSEVESWVILALGTNLLDARLDQLREVVIINRCTQRVFTEAQWKQCQEKLHGWRDSVRHILKTAQSSQSAITSLAVSRKQ